MESGTMVYAVKLPAILTAESLDSYVVVGARCPHCAVAYSVALPKDRSQEDGIEAATLWAESHMGSCGQHPAVLYEALP